MNMMCGLSMCTGEMMVVVFIIKLCVCVCTGPSVSAAL